MTFAVAPEMYDRHVGRYGAELALALIRVSRIAPGQRVLDVGSGPGVLTRALADLVGSENVAAIDPSESFVVAARARVPRADVRVASAENLPFEDGSFDAALAQLVVNFMTDPVRGVAEMRRVTRPGGTVAGCVWDYGGEMTLLRTFWDSASQLDFGRAVASDERTTMPFARAGELAQLWRDVGLRDVDEGEVIVEVDYEGFDDLWEPFTAGVAPSGAYAVALDPAEREALRAEYHRRLGAPSGPFRLRARAWYAAGIV